MSTLESVTLATAIIGGACGILGAVLGIVNTLDLVSRTRVRLRVVPGIAFKVEENGVIVMTKLSKEEAGRQARAGAPARPCVEVVNLSVFPVTISEVGFGEAEGSVRRVLVQPEVSPGKSWPTRLESREAVVLYAQVGEHLNPRVAAASVAYVKTDCGKIQHGDSPVFKEYFRALSQKGKER